MAYIIVVVVAVNSSCILQHYYTVHYNARQNLNTNYGDMKDISSKQGERSEAKKDQDDA